MILSYLMHDHPNGLEAVQRFEAGFKERNKATCCRIIKNNQSVLSRLTNKECEKLTGDTALMLFELVRFYQLKDIENKKEELGNAAARENC